MFGFLARHGFRFSEGSHASASGSAFTKAVHWPQIGLGVLGFGVSIYALILHLQSKASGGEALSCDMNDLFSCSNVLAGEYGSFLGIPLGGFGMAYFAILMGTAFLPSITQASAAWHARLRLLVSGVGALVSVGLAALSYFVINSVCSVCSTVHAIAVVAFVVAVFGWLKTRVEPAHSDGAAFMKFVSTSLAVSVPALLAGLIAPLIAPQLLSDGSADANAKLDMTQTPIPEKLLSVSKSRFVGKGEDFRKGNDDAPVVVQMFSDFQCPHCSSTNAAIEKAMSSVGEDKVLYVYRNYPLSNACNRSIGGTGHAQACQLAEAARCAGQQGKFWEMKTWAFGLIGAEPGQLQSLTSDQAIAEKAKSMGLNGDTFSACLKADVELGKIRDDIRIADELGIKGTPLIYVNNRLYSGPRTPEALSGLFANLASAAE